MPYVIDDRGLAQWVDSPPRGYVETGGYYVPADEAPSGGSPTGGASTDLAADWDKDGRITANDIELMFVTFGQDPDVHGDGTKREGGAQGLADRLNSGDLSLSDLLNQLSFQSGLPPDYRVGDEGDPSDISPTPGPRGAAGVPGVWSGGQLVRVVRPDADDKWAMIYTYGENRVSWEFDSYEQLIATIGDPLQFGGFSQLSESNYNNNITFAGNVAEITGSGSFNAWIRETINNVALEAGVADPTLWGQYVANPDIQDILFKSAIEQWSDAQTMAQIRQTDFYQNDLFPGITAFYQLDDPEAAWYQYYSNVRPVLESLDVDPGDDGYRTVIGDMLRSGVSDTAFANMSGVFMRAATSPQYAEVLNEWTQSELGRPLDFDTWYDVIAGVAEADIRDVVNKAVVAYQSSQLGAGLTYRQVTRIAEQRPALTDAESAGFLRDYLQSVTSVRDVLGRYGITADDILSASAGISSDTGRSLEEIQRLTRQAAGEAGRLDDEKIKFFLDFTPMGTPRRPGLSGLAPEAG